MTNHADQVLEWPERLPGLEQLPAYWGVVDTRWAPLFEDPPDLLVIHSGDKANWLAEYLSNPVCGPGEGRMCADGKRRRVAAAHLCYYAGKVHKLLPGVDPPRHPNTFVQCVSLRRSAPGAGGSMCQGKFGVNARAIHWELPAKPDDVQAVKHQFMGLLADLQVALPSLKYWTMHKTIDPWRKVQYGGKLRGRGRTDPVKSSGWDGSWMEGSGLAFASRH